MDTLPSTPSIIAAGRSTDDRGSLLYANDLPMGLVKRFYTVTNHQVGFVRAWHAHNHEGKFVVPLVGTVLVAAVSIPELDRLNRRIDNQQVTQIHRNVLCAGQPRVMWIPPGYGNGFKTLTPGAVVMFFSTATLAQSGTDDIRFPSEILRKQAFDVVER